jgi:tetratricopeptide (TPR) repeat protein
MGELEQAIKHMRQTLQLDPDNSKNREFYKKIKEIEEKKEAGNSAFKAGSYQIAIDLWTESIDLDNQNKAVVTKLYCNRAASYSMLKEHDKAIKDSTLALKLDTSYVKAYIRRADSYYSLGDKENIIIFMIIIIIFLIIITIIIIIFIITITIVITIIIIIFTIIIIIFIVFIIIILINVTIIIRG